MTRSKNLDIGSATSTSGIQLPHYGTCPKRYGQKFVFENISSKIALISGGKVTPAQLFINGKTKELVY